MSYILSAMLLAVGCESKRWFACFVGGVGACANPWKADANKRLGMLTSHSSHEQVHPAYESLANGDRCAGPYNGARVPSICFVATYITALLETRSLNFCLSCPVFTITSASTHRTSKPGSRLSKIIHVLGTVFLEVCRIW